MPMARNATTLLGLAGHRCTRVYIIARRWMMLNSGMDRIADKNTLFFRRGEPNPPQLFVIYESFVQKSIADTHFGHNEPGIARVFFDFSSQVGHKYPEILCLVGTAGSPYLGKQEAVRKHFSRISSHHRDESEFRWGEMYLPVVNRNGMPM